jgi:hypothetical protein
LELSEEFETEMFTGPGAATSFAGTGTMIVWQLLLEAQVSAREGRRMLAPKCTVEARESPWPFKTRLNCPLPAAVLVGEIKVMDGAGFPGAGVEDAPPPHPNHRRTCQKQTYEKNRALIHLPPLLFDL